MTDKPNDSSSSSPQDQPTSDYGDLKEYGSGPLPPKRGFEIPLAAKVLLMLFTVCLASLGYWRSQVRNDPDLQTTPADAAAIEKRVAAPDAEFTTKSGQVSKLSSYKGQVVLLTFWAHWCEPCLIELPTFRQLAGQFKDKGFVVVPVNLDTPGEADEFIANFWSNENLPFENFFDGEKKAAKLFNIDTLPANFVIDRQGRVAISSFGYNDWTDTATVDMIAQIIAEK